MHKQTYLGDNIVKELESEPTSGLVGDSDVKIGDGIGHLDVSVPVELLRCLWKGKKAMERENRFIYICFSPMSDFRESSRKVEVEVENNDQSQGTYDMLQP